MPWQSLLKILGIVVFCYLVILVFIRAEVKIFGSEKVRKALSPSNSRVNWNQKAVFWIILSVLIAIPVFYSLLMS